MGVRVGADVGGTFTKAVAIDSVTGALAGRAVVPTTHGHRDGVSAGVVDVVAKLVADVGADSIELVTHSTTQAVNALLEGDTVPVGVLCVPASVSLTVAVQVVETPTGTSGGEQATLVLVARLFTFRSNASLLALCVSSAP